MIRCVVVAVVALAAAAQAQRPGRQPLLDLSGGPQAPAPGTGGGALALASDLASSAEQMARSDDVRERARGAVRRVAAQLLRTGERAGVPGSARVLIGRTLADRIVEFDAAISAVTGPGSAATLAIIEADALAAARTLDAPGADPWRAVRDGLAALADLAPVGAARGAAPGLAGSADAWQKLPGVGAGLAASVRALDEVLTAADARAAYRPTAQRLRGLVASAAAALGSLPAWLPEPSRERLGAEFTRGVEGLLNRDEVASAEARLERVARLAALAVRTEALESNAAGQRVRTALAQAMGASAPDPAAERRGLDAYERALELTLLHHTADEDKRLVRSLRPAWRAFIAAERQAEQSLYAALPELARRPEAMTEPGIVATLNAARRAADDLQGARRLSAIMAGGEPPPGKEPEARPAWARLSARVLKLSQDMAKPASREPALASLRRILDQVPEYAAFPGEAELTGPAWDGVLGGLGQAVAGAIIQARAGHLAALEKGEPAEAEATRLDALRMLLDITRDLAALEPAGLPDKPGAAYVTLQGLGAWQLSGEALAEFASGLSEQMMAASGLAATGDALEAINALTAVRKERAVLLLAGRLSRHAAARAKGEAALALLEVTTGAPPRGAWLGDVAFDLAIVCRYAEEAPTARRTSSKAQAEAYRAFANDAAARVLETLPR